MLFPDTTAYPGDSDWALTAKIAQVFGAEPTTTDTQHTLLGKVLGRLNGLVSPNDTANERLAKILAALQ